MSLSDAISNLNTEQLQAIIKLRRAEPLVGFLAANAKARQACALRHKGWADYANVVINSMIMACKQNSFTDAYNMSTLMSAAESYAIGIIARDDLTLEEHNMLIRSVAQIATPEIIVHEQFWTPDPLPKPEHLSRQTYLPPSRATKEEDPDPDGDLIDTGIDAGKVLKALIGKKKEEPERVKVDKGDAISRMLAALKKPEKSEVKERARVEPGVGGFMLVGIETGTIFKDGFAKPAEAIVYAVKNKIALGT